jgi:glycosyltransferase involved in cell wall biosynthesis
MPGFVDNPLAFMGKASLFVLSSRFEGLPTVLIEAMACGTPVVATDCPSGPREILEGGELGGLAPVGDARALASAIGQSLDNPVTAERLRGKAEEFTVDRAVDRYLALLQPGVR